ncbi:MAG: TetR/AcrR family transcriptional regulator [Acidimicrobiia bacterium]
MSTTTPVRERGPDTATRILEAAELCIRRYGLRRVSMGDVARAAGLSRGSVYNHIQDREALIDAVLERAADRFVASSEASVKRRRTLAGQVAEAAAFIRTHGNDPILTLTPGEEPLIATLLTARVDGLVARWVEFWLPYLADAERRHEVRAGLDRPRAAEWIVRLLLSLVVMPSSVVDLDDPDAVRAYVQEFVVRGLAP